MKRKKKKDVTCFVKPFHKDINCGWIRDAGGNHVLDTRGWGHLTGTGAMGLPCKTAAIIQDAFTVHVAEALNAYKPFNAMDALNAEEKKNEKGL